VACLWSTHVTCRTAYPSNASHSADHTPRHSHRRAASRPEQRLVTQPAGCVRQRPVGGHACRREAWAVAAVVGGGGGIVLCCVVCWLAALARACAGVSHTHTHTHTLKRHVLEAHSPSLTAAHTHHTPTSHTHITHTTAALPASLFILDVSRNPNLGGALPSPLPRRLSFLAAGDAGLTGALPAVPQGSNLQYLLLGGNALSGASRVCMCVYVCVCLCVCARVRVVDLRPSWPAHAGGGRSLTCACVLHSAARSMHARACTQPCAQLLPCKPSLSLISLILLISLISLFTPSHRSHPPEPHQRQRARADLRGE
jgi:hypothetical protein